MSERSAEQSDPEYAIENGWLVELVNEHTCGTAKDGYYGAHEPGCGMVPVARVEEVLAALANAAAWRTGRVVTPPASTPEDEADDGVFGDPLIHRLLTNPPGSRGDA